MRNIINLTPHPIIIIKSDGNIEVPTSGTVARCEEINTKTGEVDGIPIYHSEFGNVINLPPKAENTIYIVSAIVKSATNDRDDVYVGKFPVRDEKGFIIGIEGLAN